MKTQQKLKMSILAFIGVITMTSLADAQTNNSKNDDVKKKNYNEKLVADAYSSGYAEVRIAESVKSRTTSPEIKDLAAMMITDHSNLNSKLKTLASTENITLKSELTMEQQKDLEKLQKKSGTELDEEYVDMLVHSHKKSVDLYEKGSRCEDDAQIQSYFKEALPKIKNHLTKVTMLDEKLKNDSKAGSMKMEE